MSQVSCNCIVCAKEFNSDELQSVALSEINVTNFKVCQACFDGSDPAEDYRDVRSVVDSYLKFTEAKHLFKEAQDILSSIKQDDEHPFAMVSNSPTANTESLTSKLNGVTYPKMTSQDTSVRVPSIGTVFDENVPNKFIWEDTEGTYLIRTRDNRVIGIEEL